MCHFVKGSSRESLGPLPLNMTIRPQFDIPYSSPLKFHRSPWPIHCVVIKRGNHYKIENLKNKKNKQQDDYKMVSFCCGIIASHLFPIHRCAPWQIVAASWLPFGHPVLPWFPLASESSCKWNGILIDFYCTPPKNLSTFKIFQVSNSIFLFSLSYDFHLHGAPVKFSLASFNLRTLQPFLNWSFRKVVSYFQIRGSTS